MMSEIPKCDLPKYKRSLAQFFLVNTKETYGSVGDLGPGYPIWYWSHELNLLGLLLKRLGVKRVGKVRVNN